MKLNELLRGGATSYGQLVRKALGKVTKSDQSVRRDKKTGRIVTLKSDDEPSRYAGIRFGLEAHVASVKRGLLQSKKERARQNTKGRPVGLSSQQYSQRRASASIPHIPGGINSTESAKRVIESETSRSNAATSKRVAENIAAREALKRPSKITRRVATSKRSCSAMRSMVDIMERRENLFA